MKIAEVRKTIGEITKDMGSQMSKGVLDEKYTDFKTSHKHLYCMITETSNYHFMLNKFLEDAERVENKEVELTEMDKIVGLDLAKKYVYPNIDMSKENLNI